jgi:RNA ligase
MLQRQRKIYDDLMKLVEAGESFYYVDQVLDITDDGYPVSTSVLAQVTYRIFLYRLASYQQWLHPSALHARGITYELDANGEPFALVSWPFEKFFNLHENPMTMDLDLSNPLEIQMKEDGSLISTVASANGLWLKSKGSLFSEQAMDAMAWLHKDENTHLYKWLRRQVFTCCRTVMMEWTAPHNRIVVPYEKPGLTILAMRDDETGEYVDIYEAGYDVSEYLVRNFVDEIDDVDAFVESIADREGIEGFVIRLESGQRVKIKTEWYKKLHHIKDSINSPRRLFENVVYDTIDDVRANFYDDPHALAMIDEMVDRVIPVYNHMVDTVERFYERNKHMERKDYAILGQKELEPLHFHLAMAKYSGKKVDYRASMAKRYKDFGITDDPEDSTDKED